MSNNFELSNRSVLKLVGKDASIFLQKITTNDIKKLNTKNSLYTLILTPQGRYIFDFFLIQTDNYILLECCSDDKHDLIKKLQMYRLQYKVKIIDVSLLYKVSIFLDDTTLSECGLTLQTENQIKFKNPMHPALGVKVIEKASSSNNTHNNSSDSTIFQKDSFQSYKKIRIKNKIPDPVEDMIKEKSFPLHYSLDKFNAIDFNKGCYIGQEVVTRMSRTQIRKKLYTASALINFPETNLSDKRLSVICNDKVIGELLSRVENIGICLLEVEKLNEALQNNWKIFINDNEVKIT